MCAKIYEKTVTDKALILAPREGLQRKFDLGSNWTEMRLGMLLAPVDAANDNTCDTVDENITLSTHVDRMTIGLKTESSDIPGVAGTNFLGVSTDENWVADRGGFGVFSTISTANYRLAATKGVGATFTSLAKQALGFGLRFNFDPSGAVDYAKFFGLKFVIANRGLATQTVTISMADELGGLGTDYSANKLRERMNNATYEALGGALDWFDGTPAALPIPNCVWIRSAAYNYRLRIHALRVIRYAP